MDIRDWPLDRIMQLPDCCFGRRWLVCAEKLISVAGPLWDIGEVALPDVCVLWNLSIDGYNIDTVVHHYRLALGDHLPAAAAEMDALEPLIMGLGVQGAEPRQIEVRPGYSSVNLPIRDLRQAQGRRLVLEVSAAALKAVSVRAIVTVSSIPKEVSDCFSLTNLRSP